MSFKKLAIGIVFLPMFLVAQDAVLQSPFHTSYSHQHNFSSIDSLKEIDTSVIDFQNYLPFNHLGNSGLAFNDLIYVPASGTGFNYFKNNYSNYFISPNSIKFYNTHSPYSDIFYATGSKKEQVFKATFSYNIKSNWNMSFDFNRIRSDGFYDRQSTNNNAIDISSNYKSQNNRYYLLAAVVYNSAKNAENGGFVEDTLAGIIHLKNAKRAFNQKSIFLKQYVNLGKKTGDSTYATVVQPKSCLVLTSYFENNSIKYEDQNASSGFYDNIYYNTAITYDSAFNNKVDNELEWKRLDNGKHRGWKDKFGLSLSMKHQYIELKQKSSLFAYNNVYAGAAFYNTYSDNRFWWNIKGDYGFEGYNKDNHSIVVMLKKYFSNELSYVALTSENNSHSPDFIYNHYYSNHFFWNNSFEKMNTTYLRANLYLDQPKLSLAVDYSAIENVLYFDTLAQAAQYNGTLGVFHASIKKDLAFFNFHLANKINYQSVSSDSVIKLPELVLEHSFYYENHLFKKAAALQIGVTLFYVAAYYANAYMPATGQFYLQDKTKTGDYPALNFFVNAKIKAVRVFFKIDHLNEGWTNTSYQLTPNYLMNGRAFKFGASWAFFD